MQLFNQAFGRQIPHAPLSSSARFRTSAAAIGEYRTDGNKTSPSRITRLHTKARHLAIGCLFFGFTQSTFAATVFINELHYDNPGQDINEGVELVGQGGISLDSWQLLFYNGSNGELYDSRSLEGEFAGGTSGYDALAFTVEGLQNGPADGLALVDGTGTVVEFLSYEGSLTATEGAASGLTSETIDLSEPGSAGQSLQRVGSGFSASDFTWQLQSQSFGTINAGQTFSASQVPLPASAWLFAGALAGLGMRRTGR